MRALTWDDFASAAGTAYSVAAGSHEHELVLDRAEKIASAGRDGGAFRLEFLGPADPVLPQATYAFRRAGDEPLEIFVVPVGRDASGTRYEAIFN